MTLPCGWSTNSTRTRVPGFNRTAAAAKLGLSLRQIRYRIARLNISLPDGDLSPDSSNGAEDHA